MTHKGLNSDDFLRLSEQVWPIQKNHLFMARKNGCPSEADLTHFGALVEREVLRRVSESQASAPAQDGVELPSYDEQEIADACVMAEIPDSKCQSLLLALQEGRSSQPPVQNPAPPSPLSEHDKEDAERYRWLRENWFTTTSTYKDCIEFQTNGQRWTEAFTEKDVDAAIDAAMRARND